MSIDKFLGTINATDVARTNRFEVSIFYPTVLGGQTNQNINLRVKTIDMPGRNISTTTNETIYGPTHDLAVGLTYADEINVTFHLSPDFNEKKWFDRWQSFVYNPVNYELEYYNDYVSNMEIYQLDVNNVKTYGIRVTECFPKTIGPVSYDTGGVSSLQTLTVGFAFREWHEMRVTPVPIQSGGDAGEFGGTPIVKTEAINTPTSTPEQTTFVYDYPEKFPDPNYVPNRYSTPEQRNTLPDRTVDTIGE